ncbi:MAG: HAMP domain-containing histidine kinase [Candidatus Desulfofervidaceae bacterium]|nr:HAMP domain-containing histidine kinase [Candidatus Desulfofervidaceae bacterium]
MLGCFALVLFVGLSAINIISISVYRYSLTEIFTQHLETEIKLKQCDKRHLLPEYIKISSEPILNPNWVPYPQTINGKSVYVNWRPVYQGIKEFAFLLFLWEVVLVLALTFLFYKLLWIHLKEREENRDFLELLLLAISHKLGNFLAAQQLNLEILKEKHSLEAVKRLERGYSTIEKDFRYILQVIKNFKGYLRKKEKINLKALIEDILTVFKEESQEKSLQLSLVPAEIYAAKTEIETVFYLLIENAFKYARKAIFINLFIRNKTIFFVVRNDVDPKVPKGSGVGLSLVQKLAIKNKIKLTFKRENGYFIVEGEISKPYYLMRLLRGV